MKPYQLVLPLALLLVQCHKKDPDPAKPEDQLPAATQTGARTFGCLLNGQPWTPSGFNGRPNIQVVYDPSFNGGNLDIRAYRYPSSLKQAQYIIFGGDQITKPGTYPITTTTNPAPPGPYTVAYADGNFPSPCDLYQGNRGVPQVGGQFTITRLDKSQGIVSGTFNFTLIQPGCDTIKITQGRFDSLL
jgi:hypothetical protein